MISTSKAKLSYGLIGGFNERPTTPIMGLSYFNNELGYEEYWNGHYWVDGLGKAPFDIEILTTNQKDPIQINIQRGTSVIVMDGAGNVVATTDDNTYVWESMNPSNILPSGMPFIQSFDLKSIIIPAITTAKEALYHIVSTTNTNKVTFGNPHIMDPLPPGMPPIPLLSNKNKIKGIYLDKIFIADMSYAFANLQFLETCFVDITRHTTDIANMFLPWIDSSTGTLMQGKLALKRLNESEWDTSKVINMSSLFNLMDIELDVSNFDTAQVTNMAYMFHKTSSKVLDVSGFDTSKVTNMSLMFYEAKADALDVSSWDTSNVTTMDSMFNKSQATVLDVSSWNTSNVTAINGMFQDTVATVLDVSGFDTSKVTLMNAMFNKSQATVLDVSSWDTSNVTAINGMFQETVATVLDVSGFDTSKVTLMNAMFNISKAAVLDVSGFDTSNVTNMVAMFAASQATVLDVSNFDTSKVTNMGTMFNFSKAAVLDVSGFDTSNVTNMVAMFAVSQATVLDVSGFDTSKVTNMNAMFAVSQATVLDVSNFNFSSLDPAILSTSPHASNASMLNMINSHELLCMNDIDTTTVPATVDKTNMFSSNPKLTAPDAATQNLLTDQATTGLGAGYAWTNPASCP